jgi:DNA-binding transcriptional LysR family regulator
VTIDLRPTVIGRFRGDTRRALAIGAIDLAFVLDAAMPLPGFRAEILREEAISVVAPAGHRLAGSELVAPSDLDADLILLPEAPDSGCEYRGQFERHLSGAGHGLDGAVEFASIETVKQCVIAGMGIAVLPTVAVETEIASGRLVALAWSDPFRVFTEMIWNERRSVSPAQAAFMSVARTVLRDE